MKKTSLLLLPIALLVTGCSSSTPNNSTSEFVPTDTVIKSPNEDGGMEGNANGDQTPTKSNTECRDLLKGAAKWTYFKVEISVNVTGTKSHFITHYAPKAYYEENDNPHYSFGYAEEKGTTNLFRYYIDGDVVTPSLYEYVDFGDGLYPMTGLYSQMSVVHLNLLNGTMDTFDAVSQGHNRYLLTDPDTASIFQYMTTYGLSITNYITATYIDIVNAETGEFNAVISLGDYGDISMKYTKQSETTSKLKDINKNVADGSLKGVEYYDDVNDFFNKVKSNNYVLEGIKQNLSTGTVNTYNYTIHCTNDYFFLDYTDSRYQDWGYALVKKGTTVKYQEQSSSGAIVTKTQKLNYDACYGFAKAEDGSFYFDFFKGPVETDYMKYMEVDELPATGNSATLYIVKNEDGTKDVYEWTQVSDGVYGFALYSKWADSVGDYYINNASATFYLKSSGLCNISKYYFQKNRTKDNAYYTNDNDVLSLLANGLFGWGFQSTTTWMDYVVNANLRVNKTDGVITSGEIGLDVLASVNGSKESTQEIYYTIKDFGNGNVSEVEDFLNNTLGGGY